MQSKALTVDEYLNEIPEERKPAISKLVAICRSELQGFEERMSYGMIGYVVPFSIYPKGYHVTPELPLPFVNIASQKNFIALYHMGLYGNKTLLDWFVSEYPKHSKKKLDMGKSCIRFKKPEDIPFDLIEELMKKIKLEDYVKKYAENISILKK
ncbi:MAG: DUF1801 domain-containing protein [Bacteroidia bacterium]|nr:DUF1801 domain-containing protein [Bacteroidia bacterium]MCF8425455.1 DUF1801 domain-containing protein [Bacteroidia bacterium]MCF8445871.1 DUF1801 domain-containing protein [Bacteroidia bacterium]